MIDCFATGQGSFTAVLVNSAGPLRAPTSVASGEEPWCRTFQATRVTRCYRATFRDAFATCESFPGRAAQVLRDAGRIDLLGSYSLENLECPGDWARHRTVPGVGLRLDGRLLAVTDGDGEARICADSLDQDPYRVSAAQWVDLSEDPWVREQQGWEEAWRLTVKLREAMAGPPRAAIPLAERLSSAVAAGEKKAPSDMRKTWTTLYSDCLTQAEALLAKSGPLAAASRVTLCSALDRVGDGAMRGDSGPRLARLEAELRTATSSAPIPLDGLRCELLHVWLTGRDPAGVVAGLSAVELRSARNEFERRRVLEKRRPEVEASLAATRNARSFVLELGSSSGFATLGTYDFERQGFPVDLPHSRVAFYDPSVDQRHHSGFADLYLAGAVPGTGLCGAVWPPPRPAGFLRIAPGDAERLLARVEVANAGAKGRDERASRRVGLRVELVPSNREELPEGHRVVFRVTRMHAVLDDDVLGEIEIPPLVVPSPRWKPALLPQPARSQSTR